ncbi:MAG: acetolactate synthase small subunit [Clostridiales bacterium]|jgi:acetolactate synthase-1/3 small subunit|nr:acetolactate synthase small subunit [Clostridiales bacterium]
MKRHVLSILVENHSGVLSRVTGLFSRRGYNIDSLSVGTTEDPKLSRITIATTGDERIINQISKQVDKLVDTVKVVELIPDESIYREIALIKVSANSKIRPEIVGIVEIFRANIIDVSTETITAEITGNESKILAFVELMEPYGIKELVRTGVTGLQRGANIIKEYNELED